jgi:hypothetical protein
MDMQFDEAASPDSFVGLFPVTWEPDEATRLEEVYRTFWQKTIDIEWGGEPDGIGSKGRIIQEGDSKATLVVEEPQPDIVKWAGLSKEPFTPSEEMILKDHSALWRIAVESGDEPKSNAQRFARLMTPFVRAGSPGVYLVGSAMLHSTTFIKQITMDLERPDALTNIFVGANDNADWMWTRGLTSFGWPELETPVESGMNAAYFRLMDIASGVIERGEPYPLEARINVGPNTFRLEEGREAPEDKQAPVAGSFGTYTVSPV